MKTFSTFLVIAFVLGFFSLKNIGSSFENLFLNKTSFSEQVSPPGVYSLMGNSNVTDIVAKAEAFKALLTAAQIDTLQQTFDTSLAQKWSNLPCGSQCRNGIEFTSLDSVQLVAAKALIAAAAGTVANEGYDEFFQIVTADSILNVNAGSSMGGGGGGMGGGGMGGGQAATTTNGYSKQYYFISFLNEPSATGMWMLQFGGHHYAANIAFNGGLVVGETPRFEGIEPKFYHLFNSVTQDSVLVAPLYTEHAAMVNVLQSLSTAEQETALITNQTFSDVLLGPNADGDFPATKAGIMVGTLSDAQKALVKAAIEPWIEDADDATADSFRTIYDNELDSTFISYTGHTALDSNTNYVRLDGPSVWIEFVCQTGVVFKDSIHYHSVWRDHKRDYGNYLASTALPLSLLSFDGRIEGINRLLSWTTANEVNVQNFDIERSVNPSQGFTSLSQVSAKNGQSNNYTYTDKEPLSEGIYYYRLKTVDKDGKNSYSKIVPLKAIMIKNITVYPNPATNKITISVANGLSNATISITNASGKILYSSLNRTGKQIDIDISKLAVGVYILQVYDGGSINTYKFMKQNSN